jgi:hypothetical protein
MWNWLETQKHVFETDLRCDRVDCVSDAMCGLHAGAVAFGDRRRWKL